MRLDRFIANHKRVSAFQVRLLLAQRQVRVNGEVVCDGSRGLTEFCHVQLGAEILQERTPIYLMLHKPKGCVSAARDAQHLTLLDLIDPALRPQLHLAGRLDFNTTGLVLLTNDGRWSRALTEPQHKTPKTYWLQTQDVITEDYVASFAQGMFFAYENLWTQPATLRILTPYTAELTLYEGRYHQVKRMFGRFNNEVLQLHRLAIGALKLDNTLAPGEYRALTPAETHGILAVRDGSLIDRLLLSGCVQR